MAKSLVLDLETFGRLVRRLEVEWMVAPGAVGPATSERAEQKPEALPAAAGVGAASGAGYIAPATLSGPADSGAGAVERSQSSGPVPIARAARVRSTLLVPPGAAA